MVLSRHAGMGPVLSRFAAIMVACAAPAWANAAEGPKPAPPQVWSFKGPLGHFDLAAVQRGYGVYAAVCATCHGLAQVHFSDLADMGLDSEQVLALAASWRVPDGLDAHNHLQYRKGRPDDAFPMPFGSPAAAKAANGGIIPPDLSRMVSVYPGGADRVYALLTGFAPDARHVEGKGFANPYAIGHFTAMPPPWHEGALHYADGTEPTVQQQARDVTTFLAWVSAPHQDTRHRLGVGAGLYLCFLALLFVLLNRRVWSDVRK